MLRRSRGVDVDRVVVVDAVMSESRARAHESRAPTKVGEINDVIDEGGTRGSRTLIPRGKSPVLGRLS